MRFERNGRHSNVKRALESEINVIALPTSHLADSSCRCPPLIGFWPAIQRRVVARATQITACDVAVGVAFGSLIVIRIRLDRHLARDA
jgi:hypothetical protein